MRHLKRKLLTIILLSTVLCMSACGGQSSFGSDTGQDTQENVGTSLVGDVQVEPPVEVELPGDMESMLAPMDAIMMCGAERGFDYNVDDPEVFWRLMYYNIGNHGSNHSLAKVDKGILQLDYSVVLEFATGMFVNYSDLPVIPECLSDSITYDESLDAYMFSLGDRGLSQAEILKCMKNADGSYDVTARLYDVTDGQTIVSAKFHLETNPYADGITNPMFLYTISSADEITE